MAWQEHIDLNGPCTELVTIDLTQFMSMPSTNPAWFWVAVCTVVFAGGCAGLEQVQQAQPSSPGTPVWNQARLQETIQLLQQQETTHGEDATVHIRRVITTGLSGLQTLGASEQHMRRTPQPTVQAHTALGVVFADGVDIWPHAGSDSGNVEVTTVQPGGFVPDQLTPGVAVVMPKSQSETQVGSNAAPVTILLGDLEFRTSHPALSKGIAVQMTYAAWSRLTGMDMLASEAWLADGSPLVLPSPLTVNMELHPAAVRFEVLRLLAGKDPTMADELVIVGTDLVTGSRSDWMAVAVLTEMARQMAVWSSRWMYPRRSVLFAIWSDRSGLEEFLRRPPWLIDHLAEVVYVGQDSSLPGQATIPLHLVDMPIPGETIDTDSLKGMELLHKAVVNATGSIPGESGLLSR